MTDRFNKFDDDTELDLNVSLKNLSFLSSKEKENRNKNETKNNKKRPINDPEIFESRKRYKREDKNENKKEDKRKGTRSAGSESVGASSDKKGNKVSSEINELYYV